jgi:energy-coupling factor transport system permease protein
MKNLDARIKLLIAVALSSAAFVTYNLIFLGGLLAVSVTLALLGRLPARELILKLRVMLALVFSLFVIQGLSMGLAGLTLAAALTLRLLVLVFSGAFLLSSHIREYNSAFNKMHVPRELTFMIMVAIKFVPLLREEAAHVKNAMVSRGRNFATLGIRGRLAAYAEFSSALICLTILRAKALAMSCESRCIFGGKR